MKLTDPYFEAEFYGSAAVDGSFRRQGGEIEGAQGLWLWCLCGRDDPRYADPPGPKPHGCMIPFANPRNAPPLPPDHGPTSSHDETKHPRWTMAGTGLADLTISPSVAVGDPECWHGHILNGEVS